MCYITEKTIDDAPLELTLMQAKAWLEGVKVGFAEAMEIIAERDEEEDS